MIKKICRTLAPVCAAAMLLGACQSKTALPGAGNARQSQSYASAEEAIAQMKATDWKSSEVYNDVLTHYIRNATSLGEGRRLSLTSSLNQAYAEQLVRTQREILAGPCAASHATLEGAHREYGRCSDSFGAYTPEGKDAVDAAWAEHQRMMAFAVSPSYSGALSYTGGYDSSYDQAKRSEAASIRAKNPTCTAICQKVSAANVDKILAQRKQNYYNALAAKFCRDPHVGYDDLTAVKSRLSCAPNAQALLQKVAAHYDAVNSRGETPAEPEPGKSWFD